LSAIGGAIHAAEYGAEHAAIGGSVKPTKHEAFDSADDGTQHTDAISTTIRTPKHIANVSAVFAAFLTAKRETDRSSLNRTHITTEYNSDTRPFAHPDSSADCEANRVTDCDAFDHSDRFTNSAAHCYADSLPISKALCEAYGRAYCSSYPKGWKPYKCACAEPNSESHVHAVYGTDSFHPDALGGADTKLAGRAGCKRRIVSHLQSIYIRRTSYFE
jgi:hypothetical protein